MFFLYEPPTAAVNLAFLSFMLHNIVKIEAGIKLPVVCHLPDRGGTDHRAYLPGH